MLAKGTGELSSALITTPLSLTSSALQQMANSSNNGMILKAFPLMPYL